jgi:hypothetical protein
MPVQRLVVAQASCAEPASAPPPPATLPVIVYIRDVGWAFEVILGPCRLPAGLPAQLVIASAGDGLSAAGTAIAGALRAAGTTALTVRFYGVIDDFAALSRPGSP